MSDKLRFVVIIVYGMDSFPNKSLADKKSIILLIIGLNDPNSSRSCGSKKLL